MTKKKEYQNYLDQKSPDKYPWALAIIIRRELESDSYEGFTLELLDMVRVRAQALVKTIHTDRAVTPKMRRSIVDLSHMLDEAEIMAKLSPKVATRCTRYVTINPIHVSETAREKARSKR
ncbi:hypothetical protein [Methylopila sp. M107]|uniref:hypothetical protein n=1 Tax=Methylopila sp. M107 TaxID=1101190 RepID=UPI0012DF5360|nr:hypothetical protein [Methylopila sp. M107]